uniref:U-box domain-containing protein n=1 Tax=Oryza rufipogon TaxID=4529 RepID=A0A0E0Q4R9_ORYRU
MAETKIIHATKQAEVAVTKFIESDIRNEQTSQRNIAGNSVKTSSSNTIEAPGHVVVTNSSDAGQDTMVNNNVAGNYVLLPLSNRTEAPRHVIVTISLDAGQNTVVDDNGVRQGLTDEESDTKTKLLERGVLTAASATAAMLSPFLRGVFNHHQEGDSDGLLGSSRPAGMVVVGVGVPRARSSQRILSSSSASSSPSFPPDPAVARWPASSSSAAAASTGAPGAVEFLVSVVKERASVGVDDATSAKPLGSSQEEMTCGVHDPAKASSEHPPAVSPDEAALSILHSLKLSEESFKRVLEGSGGEDFLETLAPSAKAVKVALHVLCRLCPWSRNRVKAVDVGAVSALVHLLLNEGCGGDRRACELAVMAIDHICGCAEGHLALVAHPTGLAATRLSTAGTESTVRALHVVATHTATSAVLQEMLAVGVGARLFFLVQVGASGKRTRARWTTRRSRSCRRRPHHPSAARAAVGALALVSPCPASFS